MSLCVHWKIMWHCVQRIQKITYLSIEIINIIQTALLETKIILYYSIKFTLMKTDKNTFNAMQAY